MMPATAPIRGKAGGGFAGAACRRFSCHLWDLRFCGVCVAGRRDEFGRVAGAGRLDGGVDRYRGTPRPNRANVTGTTTGWKKALNALVMYYGERITEN
jgi:hypothetical protein